MRAAERLQGALLELADTGGTTPCQADPEAWFEGHPEQLASAAARCAGCPIMTDCAAAADENNERIGVWGGQDRAVTKRREVTEYYRARREAVANGS
ncbi:WhiB family transcriptional regulator [Jatrophihabitans sp. DSM 45814]